MRSIARAIILIPIALAAVAFAVANKEPVSVSFDPFAVGVTDFKIDTPLFVVVFAFLILGVLLGGIATWISQGRHRRAERMHRRDVERLRADIDRLRAASGSIAPSH
jgi:uncharacterized integral membrane protein